MTIKEMIEKTKSGTVKSYEMNIQDVFSDDNIFSIKEFQRKYEWGDLQVSDLFNEINSNKKMDYFIGMIILKKEIKNGKKFNISIVDGQQRITTLFLLLKSIESSLRTFKEDDNMEKVINDIRNIFLCNDYQRIKISEIRGEGELKDILINNLQDYQDIENPIYMSTYKSLLLKLENYKKESLYDLFDKIKKIKFSVVILGKKINEYKVFEDLNSKGVDLKIDDLLRNYYAQKIKKFHTPSQEESIEFYVNEYEHLLNKVEVFLRKEKDEFRKYFSNQIGRWFKSYIMYVVNWKVNLSDRNDKRMYQTYKDAINKKLENQNDVLNEISSLKEYLDFCEWINKNDSNEKYLINDIEFYPIIFTFYKNIERMEDDKKEVTTTFVVLMYLHFYSMDINMKAFLKKNFERIKNTLSLNHINKKEKIEKILKIIFGNKIESKSFEKLFIESIKNAVTKDWNISLKKTTKRFSMFILANIEKLKYANEIELKNHYYNIEHIIPQNENLNLDPNQTFKKLMLWINNVNKMSNLVLIEKKLNEDLGNKSFEEKKKIIIQRGSNLKIVEEVFANDVFDDEVIGKRTKTLMKDIEIIVNHYYSKMDELLNN